MRVTVPMETRDRIRTPVSWTSSIPAITRDPRSSTNIDAVKGRKTLRAEERLCSGGQDFIVGGISDCLLTIEKREERSRDSIQKSS